MTTKTLEPDLTLSDAAIARIKALQEKQSNTNLVLRVTVDAGGCSGFQYKFTLEDGKKDDDIAFTYGGVTLITDATSLELINGSEIDFKEELIGAAFTINNPKAASSCGCGSSFAV